MSLPVVKSEDLLKKAADLLSPEELKAASDYIKQGKLLLAPDTAAKFFELYLNGSTVEEIHRLNKAFPIEAIHLARVKYGWDMAKDTYVMDLQASIRQKVMKAQMESTALLTDVLSAAYRMHGDKLKKYLQTGDESSVKGVFGVESIAQLLKVVDSLQKITGQSNQIKVKTESHQTIDVNLNKKTEDISEETAAKIIAAIAEEKRNKARSE